MENVLEELGSCGPFQICHVTLVQLCRFVSAWAMSLMIFGLYNPGWRCANTDSPNISSNDLGQPRGLTPPSDSRVSLYDSAMVDRGRLFENHRDATDCTNSLDKDDSIYSYNSSCDVFESCSNSIKYNPDSSTIVTEFNLICDQVWIAYLILSVLSAGILVGSFVWAQVGELFGRRFGLYASNITMTLSCGLAIFSPGWEVYAVFTFFIGFAVTGVMTNVAVLCMEFLNWQWRARITAFPIWNAGGLTFALAAYLLRDWKLIHLATATVCGLSCLSFFWTPESLRWLVIHTKTASAEKVLTKIVKLNGKPMTIDRLEELVDKREGEIKDRHYTYLDLFKTRAVRQSALKLVLLWAIVTAVYEVIGFGIQSLPGDFYTNFFIASVAEFPGVLVIGPLANKLGRRWTGIVFMSIGTLCCAGIIITLFTTDADHVREISMNSLAFIDRAAMVAMISFLTTYTTELMPTVVRNLSFGLCQVSVRIVGMLTPFLLPRDFFSMVLCFAVLLAAQILAIGLFCSLEETKNNPLKDSILTDERNSY